MLIQSLMPWIKLTKVKLNGLILRYGSLVFIRRAFNVIDNNVYLLQKVNTMYKVIELASGMITSFDMYDEAISFVSNNIGYVLSW